MNFIRNYWSKQGSIWWYAIPASQSITYGCQPFSTEGKWQLASCQEIQFSQKACCISIFTSICVCFLVWWPYMDVLNYWSLWVDSPHQVPRCVSWPSGWPRPSSPVPAQTSPLSWLSILTLSSKTVRGKSDCPITHPSNYIMAFAWAFFSGCLTLQNKNWILTVSWMGCHWYSHINQ